MIYLIDGHNVIGQLPDVSLDDPNDEALLVQKLISFTARTRHRCVVVFDHGLPGGTSRMSTRNVQVVFASQRSTADRVMIERIGKIPDPGQWTVVSSDNDVMGAARGRRMQTMRSADFAFMLQSPPAPDIDAGEASNVELTPDEVEEWMRFFGGDNGKTRFLHPEKSAKTRVRPREEFPPDRRTPSLPSPMASGDKSGGVTPNKVDEWLRFFGMDDERPPKNPPAAHKNISKKGTPPQKNAPRPPTETEKRPTPKPSQDAAAQVDQELVVDGGERGEIVGKLLLRIGLHVEQRKLGRVTAPGTIYLLDRESGRTAQPAVAFVASARAPGGLPRGRVPFAPDLAIEVVVSGERPRSLMDRIEQYLAAGTRLVWVVYPDEQVVDVWRRGERGLIKQKAGIDGSLDGEDVLPGFRMAVRGIFPRT